MFKGLEHRGFEFSNVVAIREAILKVKISDTLIFIAYCHAITTKLDAYLKFSQQLLLGKTIYLSFISSAWQVRTLALFLGHIYGVSEF